MEKNKYEKFVIYKIQPIDKIGECYIGSTINFSRRKSQHKKNTTNRKSKMYSYPLYQYIRTLGGFDKMTMEIIDKFPCKSKKEGLIRERELITINKAGININNPIKI